MEYEQPIYFIGVALPESLNARVGKLIWELYDKDNPRMLKPLLPHVTLTQIKHPQTLNRGKTVGTIEQAISLPVRFEATSLTCFRRILPRTYQPEGI